MDSVNFLKALFLGVLEGLTEFIPVSSTGHLIIAGDFIGFESRLAGSFEVFIQLGAILAVVVLYWPRFRSYLMPWRAVEQSDDLLAWSGALKLIVGTIPALVSGYLFHSVIKSYLFFPIPVAFALLVGGLALVFIRGKEDEEAVINSVDQLSYRQCFLIGVFQCLALWPGVSRSGATIIGGLCLGLSKKAAAEFSFLLAVPVMIAAVSYDMYKSFHAPTIDEYLLFAVGFITAFVTAIFAIKFFMRVLQTFSLAVFGYYRIVLAILVLVLLGW